ncbi:MAG TPA: polysaccharide biosynthesis/export family protein [Candidatus Dormibacteraeota bacterium]|nr:polysaccharide biosynthesis/export family protein [Candidatus Dormibacteraeota bacterium]
MKTIVPWLVLLGFGACGCRHASPSVKYGQFKNTTEPPPALASVTLSNRIQSSWLLAPTQPFTLGPGDKLEIEVLGEPTSRVTTIVAPDGKIYFNLLPGIDVWGATVAQAKIMLETELAKYERQRPQVSVILRGIESKRIWVLGRVQAPGVFSLTAPMTLLEAISMAGGTLSPSSFQNQDAAAMSEELADLNRSFVIRQGKLLPVNFQRLLQKGDMSQNIYLQPDDFVYLPAATAREIYVLGAVAQPRPVAYSEGMTVAAAVAAAYGTIRGAYMHHIAVVRGSLTEPQIAIVDYRRVIRGEAQDIALQPHDIVYVPFSPYRYLDKYLELVLNTFVSAAAINAGTSAASKNNGVSGGAGVFIPVGSGVQILPPVTPPPIR